MSWALGRSTLFTVRVITAIYICLLALVVVSAGMGWFRPAFEAVQKTASDKVLHFILVGGMAFWLNLSMSCSSFGKTGLARIALQWGTVGMLVLATIEEFTQIFLPNRSFDLGDMACNYLGIVVLGSLAYACKAWGTER